MVERQRTARSGEVAAAIGMSAASVQAYARSGRLPFRLTPGRQYRFNLDEVREILAPPAVTPVDGLPDVFTATDPLVKALSGYRPSPFSDTVVRRLRLGAQRPEAALRGHRETARNAGARDWPTWPSVQAIQGRSPCCAAADS